MKFKKVCSSFRFSAHFTGSYKDLQITQESQCVKHVELLQTSSVLLVNYKIRKIHSNICTGLTAVYKFYREPAIK